MTRSNLVALATASLALAACTGEPAAPRSSAVSAASAEPEYRHLATCSSGGYFGGYGFEIEKSTQDAKAKLTIQKVSGPNGNGESTEPVTLAGVQTNDDERDPYMWLFTFSGSERYELTITLERREDLYPANLEITGADGTESVFAQCEL